ncbi:hypothetical protein MJO29_007543 [Puccinia striiformis f. sp. tritici]|nr:hypothetical protein MJO29_007543 [Puccinia striiformis f. sp. tritici]
MADLATKNSIPILTDNNFSSWKNTVYLYCQQKATHRFLLSDRLTSASEEQKEDWEDKKSAAVGVLTHYMGEDNRATTTPKNQTKVYQKFLGIKFKSNLSELLVQVDKGIANMRAVGITIRIPLPTEPTVNEYFLAEQIVNFLPKSFEITKDLLLSKRPLTLKVVRKHLGVKALDSSESTTSIKTESALKVAQPFCENGRHNPKTKHRPDQCYQLHPDQAPEGYKNKQKAFKKAHLATTSDNSPPGDDSDNRSVASHEGAYYCISTRKALSICRETQTIFLDSGCSDHMFPSKDIFFGYKPFTSSVSIADGQTLPIVGSGFVQLRNSDGSIHTLKALHVPQLSHALVSFGRLFLKNCDLVRESIDTFAVVSQPDNKRLFEGSVEGKVFTIKASVIISNGQSFPHQSLKSTQIDSALVHRRAGHPSAKALKLMFGIDYSTLSCDSCRLSKSHRLPFSGTLPPASRLLDFVYMDLSRKITPPTIGGGLYYFKITDAFSSFKHVYILSAKSQAFEKFKVYLSEVKNFHNLSIRNVVTDGGGEFCSHEFEDFYREQGCQP